MEKTKSEEIEKKVISTGIILILALLGIFLKGYHLYLLNEILIMAIFSYGFSLLFSHSGYLSFGQAAFYSAGGYTVALMYRHVGDSTWIAFLAAIFVTFVISSIIGFLSVRLGRIYFALLTLGFAQMIFAVVFRSRFTGGDDGIPGIRPGPLDFGLFEISLTSPTNYYYFTLVLFLISVFIIHRIIHSPFGYTIRSMRDNPERATFIGINVLSHARIVFVISAIFAGLAGALYVPLAKYASPALAHFETSGDPVMACLIGGLYTFSGPFVGSIVYTVLKSYLMTTVGNYPLVMGPILLFLVLFFRNGIMGFIAEKIGKNL
ncbi:MAG: branched-chain amino acid ABC transporter permease [Candidatus Bathyarchaeia archaeon]